MGRPAPPPCRQRLFEKLAIASNYSRRRLSAVGEAGEGRRLREPELRAWRAFIYAYARVVRTLDDELVRAVGIGLNQFEALTWLRRAGHRGLRMSDLASRVVLSPSGLTRAVDQLERKGLVERCVFEGDRRGQLAKLTTAGRALLRRATSVHVRGLREHFLNHVGGGELGQLTRTLETVLSGEGAPLPRLSQS
jgi:DNA-binding MarR family transcriptional regulator